MKKSDPIGVFDSGIGGLTVFREISRLLPQEDLIYLGDSAHLPYGDKSPEAIRQFTQMSASFLSQLGVKLLVIACHTASAHTLTVLQESLSIPVVGVIQSGFKLLMATTKLKRVAILATASTVASGVYQQLISPQVTLFAIACPLFVPLVEERFFDRDAALLAAHHYLQPLQAAQIDAALLACTHYPLLQGVIEQVLGSSVAILEPGGHCAEQVQEILRERNLLNPQKGRRHQFYVTDHVARFSTLAQTFLGYELEELSLASLDKQF